LSDLSGAQIAYCKRLLHLFLIVSTIFRAQETIMASTPRRKKKKVKRHRRERLPGDETEAASIEGFCRQHGISIAFYYELRKKKRAPREVTIGRRVLITKENAADWRASLPERRDTLPAADVAAAST
jgi:hypothetical protein